MKYLLSIIILILIPGCSKPKSFDYFEISYDNGWTGDYSFAIVEGSTYYYQTINGHIKGELTDQQYQELEKDITGMQHANLKSSPDNCCDGSAFAIRIYHQKDTISAIQRVNIDKRMFHIAKTIRKIVAGKPFDTATLRYDFRTMTDLIIAPTIPAEFVK